MNGQADLNFLWAQMSEGMYSDFAPHFNLVANV